MCNNKYHIRKRFNLIGFAFELFQNILGWSEENSEIELNRGYSNVWNKCAIYFISEAKNAYFMSGKAINEIYIFSLQEMK